VTVFGTYYLASCLGDIAILFSKPFRVWIWCICPSQNGKNFAVAILNFTFVLYLGVAIKKSAKDTTPQLTNNKITHIISIT